MKWKRKKKQICWCRFLKEQYFKGNDQISNYFFEGNICK